MAPDIALATYQPWYERPLAEAGGTNGIVVKPVDQRDNDRVLETLHGTAA